MKRARANRWWNGQVTLDNISDRIEQQEQYPHEKILLHLGFRAPRIMAMRPLASLTNRPTIQGLHVEECNTQNVAVAVTVTMH